MGFNNRLAPYVVAKQILVRESSNDAAVSQHFPVYKFPFAGMLVGAYANVALIQPAADNPDVTVEATTSRGVDEISLWKHATADTTATYATGLRAAKRTGAQDTSSAAAPGINWRLPHGAPGAAAGTSGEKSMYALTNQTAARRKFLAGDVVMMHFGPYAPTDSHRMHRVDIQMDFIIGHEA